MIKVKAIDPVSGAFNLQPDEIGEMPKAVAEAFAAAGHVEIIKQEPAPATEEPAPAAEEPKPVKKSAQKKK